MRWQKGSRLVKDEEPTMSGRRAASLKLVERPYDSKQRAFYGGESVRRPGGIEIKTVALEQLAGAPRLGVPVYRPAVLHGDVSNEQVLQHREGWDQAEMLMNKANT